MPNIFTHTGYQPSEEDRLTNALACLLKQADPEVLRSFLELAGMDGEQVLENTLARVELQTSFSQSCPDATLHLSRADVVIETKRGFDGMHDLAAHLTHGCVGRLELIEGAFSPEREDVFWRQQRDPSSFVSNSSGSRAPGTRRWSSTPAWRVCSWSRASFRCPGHTPSTPFAWGVA